MHCYLKYGSSLLLALVLKAASAQSYSVTQTQELNFGTFSVNSGGSITISNQNVRTTTGDVILLGASYHYSIFSITTNSATPITLQVDQPSVNLTSPDGNSILLEYGVAQPEHPVVSAGNPAVVYIGGTLQLGSKSINPAGTYTGNVLLTFTIHNE